MCSDMQNVRFYENGFNYNGEWQTETIYYH